MSYDPNGEYWRARAEIAEAELAEHHKGFKETSAAMVRNAKERDEWRTQLDRIRGHLRAILQPFPGPRDGSELSSMIDAVTCALEDDPDGIREALKEFH